MEHLDSLVERLLGMSRPMLVGLDVDGTLAPIAHDPGRARIPEHTLEALRTLCSTPGFEVALVTGRDLPSLRGIERLDGVWRGVEHGGLVLAPGEEPGPRELPSDKRYAVEEFRTWAKEHASDAFVEYKPQGVAIHVRQLSEVDPERARNLLEEADRLGTQLGLHMRRGRCLREAEAKGHNKGDALREIYERSGARSVFFAGDDLTDFPAIEFAADRGVGAFVRSDEQPGVPLESVFVFDGVDEVAYILSALGRRWRS